MASSPFLWAGAESSDPWHVLQSLCACTSLAGDHRKEKCSFPLKTNWRTGRNSCSVSSCLLMQVYFPLRHNWERCTHTKGRSEAVVYVHVLGLEKCPYPVSIALYFGSSFIQAPACCQNMNVFPGTWDRLTFSISPENTFSEPSPWAGVERATFCFFF